MYYKEGFIENLINQVNIVTYITRFVELECHGKYFWGLCPFHQEKSPSFMVDPFSGTFTCFGCGQTGNIISFVMKYYEESFIQAVRRLANEYNIEIELDSDETQIIEYKKYIDEKEELYQINQAAADYFHYLLFQEENEGLQYFKHTRRLTKETIKHFYLGYMNADAETFFEYLKKKGFQEEIIFKSKLMGRNDTGKLYSFFRNRAMIPIFDWNGRVIGFGGRVLKDEDSPKYLNSPETIVFDKRRNLFGFDKVKNVKEKGIIVCEGYMDVIALHQAGFTNAVASLGTAFTTEQASLIKHDTDKVYLSFDADDAGCNAISKSIAICQKFNLKIKTINMDPYKDPDEFIKELGSDIYQERINNSISDQLFLLRYLEKKVDLKNNQEINFKNLPKKLSDFAKECSKIPEEKVKKYEKFMSKYAKIVDFYFDFIKKH